MSSLERLGWNGFFEQQLLQHAVDGGGARLAWARVVEGAGALQGSQSAIMRVEMMMPGRRFRFALAVAAATVLSAWALVTAGAPQPEKPQPEGPRPPAFRVDPSWPIVPSGWVLGEVTSIAVDPHDRIWVLHRPRSIPADKRAQAAPPVLEFDAAGKLLNSWGGEGHGYDWPEREHGIFVDARGSVWISGNGGWPRPTAAGSGDDMILKFTDAGKLVMQIGHRGQSKGNTDTENVHQPADTFVDARANELYVADGYGDQRIVVFDANTGRFKRMWGAFGNAPTPGMTPNPPVPQPQEPGTDGPPQFGLPHAVKVSNDGTVYVADRINNRIQLFTTAGKYLRTVRVTSDDPAAVPVPAGFSFSPDKKQQFLYVVDSGPMRLVIFDRETMKQVGAVGMRGAGPGEFNIVHHMAADSKGNLYTAEIVTNRRAQRFVLQGGR